MPKLIIHQTREYGRIQKGMGLGIYLNGKKVGVIHSNETKVFELEVGRYELRIKTAMLHHLAEQSIDLSEQEVKKLELSANKKMLKKFLMILLILLFIGLIYSWVMWFFLCYQVYLLVYMLKGSLNELLVLKEVNEVQSV